MTEREWIKEWNNSPVEVRRRVLNVLCSLYGDEVRKALAWAGRHGKHDNSLGGVECRKKQS
jgi:hypothetical protein